MSALAACTSWPDAVAWCVLFVAVAACYIAWRVTGGTHHGQK